MADMDRMMVSIRALNSSLININKTLKKLTCTLENLDAHQANITSSCSGYECYGKYDEDGDFCTGCLIRAACRTHTEMKEEE